MKTKTPQKSKGYLKGNIGSKDILKYLKQPSSNDWGKEINDIAVMAGIEHVAQTYKRINALVAKAKQAGREEAIKLVEVTLRDKLNEYIKQELIKFLELKQ